MKMRTLQRRRRRFNLLDRPYVLWTLRDGSQVLANRHYDVIAERAWPRGVGHIIDRWRWVEDIAEERWLLTPRFTTDDVAACRRWSNDTLWRFLDGRDMDLQPYPIVRHLPNGEELHIDRDGVRRLRTPSRRRPAPPDWLPPWPDLRVHVEPANVPLVPARISRNPFFLPPEPTRH